jgi:hypothetical protein
MSELAAPEPTGIVPEVSREGQQDVSEHQTLFDLVMDGLLSGKALSVVTATHLALILGVSQYSPADISRSPSLTACVTLSGMALPVAGLLAVGIDNWRSRVAGGGQILHLRQMSLVLAFQAVAFVVSMALFLRVLSHIAFYGFLFGVVGIAASLIRPLLRATDGWRGVLLEIRSWK